MITRSFQSRLGHFQDRLKRKLIDNQISLAGNVVDFIRVRTTNNKQGDIQTRVVEDAKVLPFMFPPLKDVPLRRMVKGTDKTWKLETLPAANELFPVEVYTAYYSEVYLEDLLFRVLLEPDVETPLVMCYQVIESLATFGAQSVIYGKFNVVYYNQALPPEIIETVDALARRRGMLGW